MMPMRDCLLVLDRKHINAGVSLGQLTAKVACLTLAIGMIR